MPQPSRSVLLYCVDIFLYQLIIVCLVVGVWRSLWNVYNDVVLPDQKLYSNLITHGAGNLICIVIIAIQKPLKELTETCKNFPIRKDLCLFNFNKDKNAKML